MNSRTVVHYSTLLRESLLGQKIQNNLLALVKQTPKGVVDKEMTKRSNFNYNLKLITKQTQQ